MAGKLPSGEESGQQQLNMRKLCAHVAEKVSGILPCIRSSKTRRTRAVNVPLYWALESHANIINSSENEIHQCGFLRVIYVVLRKKMNKVVFEAGGYAEE
ncbi:hypothetical protein WISP_117017 [Willisornis vidua]|uniref:Uncharacterized protein n=1 Tax=Willisornis vidua TaxID=1566151 RepID=A0ABQ9CUL9_9PASS|nr:hypothetical protein WISP_117017 [Willisornis vidua]